MVTGAVWPTDRMIRFVVAPSGQVIPDVAEKLPGRGGWILADRAVLQQALKKQVLIRFGHMAETKTGKAEAGKAGEKKKITVIDDLPGVVECLLRQRCLDYLGLVKRAGLLVSGFEKVRGLLQSGGCAVLISAADAADNGRQKISAGLKISGDLGNVLDKSRIIDMFTREQLGQALGLANPVHLGLLPGGITESFLVAVSRYGNVARDGS